MNFIRNPAVYLLAIWGILLPSAVSASDLAQAQLLCSANPDCSQLSNEETGSFRFEIKRTGRSIIVRCDRDRHCGRSYPRGVSSPIRDLHVLFAVK